jgi:hypothetical protein
MGTNGRYHIEHIRFLYERPVERHRRTKAPAVAADTTEENSRYP